MTTFDESVFWTRPDWTSDPVERVGSAVDVAIVGAGLVGLSCAYHLLVENPGSSVAVFDAADLGGGASGRTTGMVTPGVGQDFARLMTKLGRTRAAAAYQITREAVQYVSELIATEEIACEHHSGGQLVVARGAAGSRRLERQAQALTAAGQPYERLNGDALVARISLDRTSATKRADALAAIYISDAATLHPRKFSCGLARAIQRRGGKIVCNARVTAIHRGSSPSLTLASGHTVNARAVVVSTGSESTELVGLTGRIIPIRLKVAVTQPLSASQMTALGWHRRECIVDSRKLFNYFRLTDDDRIVFGGGAPVFGTQTRLDFSDLRHELRQTFAFADNLEIATQWGGTIDYTLDAMPVIGHISNEKNLIYAGGFCGHGIALGILSGKWVSEMLGHRLPQPPLPWFRRTAPLIPGQWLRKICFDAATGWMRLRNA